ncbi:MAG TPA: hypothetical protein VG323_14165 [Thermoanaerobaculia bacterium]|nr:hypothetical protein [Thermoanaerobaculia bacterium]
MTRRILILALFVAGFVLAPMASALSACAMPCCQHSAKACPMKCTVSKAAPEEPAVASVGVQPSAPVVAVELAPAPQRVIVDIGGPPIPPHRPLHLVYSVFLI